MNTSDLVSELWRELPRPQHVPRHQSYPRTRQVGGRKVGVALRGAIKPIALSNCGSVPGRNGTRSLRQTLVCGGATLRMRYAGPTNLLVSPKWELSKAVNAGLCRRQQSATPRELLEGDLIDH